MQPLLHTSQLPFILFSHFHPNQQSCAVSLRPYSSPYNSFPSLPYNFPRVIFTSTCSFSHPCIPLPSLHPPNPIVVLLLVLMLSCLLPSVSLPNCPMLLKVTKRLCVTTLCVLQRLAFQYLVFRRDDLEGSWSSSFAPRQSLVPSRIDRTLVTRSHYMPYRVITSLCP